MKPPDIAPLFAGTFETLGDWIGWLIVAVFFIGPFAVLITLLLLRASSAVSKNRPGRLLTLLLGFVGSAAGICIGGTLYMKSYSPTPALVWCLVGAVIGGLCGLFVAIAAKLLMRMFRVPRNSA